MTMVNDGVEMMMMMVVEMGARAPCTYHVGFAGVSVSVIYISDDDVDANVNLMLRDDGRDGRYEVYKGNGDYMFSYGYGRDFKEPSDIGETYVSDHFVCLMMTD